MSAAPSGRFTTRSEIEDYDTSHFADAATRWRTAAAQSDEVFAQHRLNIATPGGTTWEGDAKDAALDRVTADVAVAGNQNGVVREAAGIAEDAITDINAAQREVVEAITTAEDDGFTVAEDFKVTDTRRYDVATAAERNRAAAVHAEDVRWYAERFGQTVAFVEGRLRKKAGELARIRFEGEGEGRDGEPTVQLVDNKTKAESSDDRKDEQGGKPTEQATGQIGPFAVPKSVEEAAKQSGLKPDEKSEDKPEKVSDVGGDLGDLLGANDPPTPGSDPKPAAPPISPQAVEQFKAQARNLLRQHGVPRDQIESQVNAMVADAQRMNATLGDLPPHTPTAAELGPRPSYSDGFGDAWRGLEDSVHDLAGYNGFEDFKDAWKDLGAGVAETVKDPYGTLVRGIADEFSAAKANPEYWLGEKAFDAAAGAATLPFGAEGAFARGALDDVARAGIPHDVVHPPHIDTPSPHVDHPPPVSPDETVRASPDAGGGYTPHNPVDHSPVADSGDRPVVPAPDGLDHHEPIGPGLPPSVEDIHQWLPEINHGPGMDPFDPARAVNCGQCALAVDQRLTGAMPDASAGLGTLSIPEMESATGLRQVPATPSEIEQYLINQGAGAHTVIGVDRAGAAGHWFNAYYDGTKVYAVDGQTGEIVGWPPNMDFPGRPVTQWDMGVQK